MSEFLNSKVFDLCEQPSKDGFFWVFREKGVLEVGG